MTATRFPVGGPRQPVYNYLRGLGFEMTVWSDKVWKRFDGTEVRIFGSGSMARIGAAEMPLDDLAPFLKSIADRESESHG
jgi:hypothetical protein